MPLARMGNCGVGRDAFPGCSPSTEPACGTRGVHAAPGAGTVSLMIAGRHDDPIDPHSELPACEEFLDDAAIG